MDKFKIVNFAQKKGYQIEDPILLGNLKSLLLGKYKLTLKTGNKLYKFLEESDLPVLKAHPHVVCFNLNQKPTYLLLTTCNGQKLCIYFDYEMKEFITVKHRFNEQLYDDTLFEGELVKVSQQHYIFLMSDLHVYKKKIQTQPVDKKISLLRKIISKQFKSDPGLDPCQILIKDFVEYDYLESFVNDYLTTVSYQQFVNGLIFRPLVKSNKNIIMILNKKDFHQIKIPGKFLHKNNTTTSLIDTVPKKKKPKIDTKHVTEVVFQIKETAKPDVYELWLLSETGTPFKYGIASIPTRECSETVKELFQNKSTENPLLVRCVYQKNFNKWMPVTAVDADNPDTLFTLF